MEMFNGCPFSHFAAHGLKLRERQIYRLDAPDIGEMFHGALKMISDYLYEASNFLEVINKAAMCATCAKSG